MNNTPLNLAVICAPGLEFAARRELESLGYAGPDAPPRPEPGLIELSATAEDVMRLNLMSRTASRVLVRLGSFHAAAFSELRKKASRLPWAPYLAPGAPVRVRATTHLSKLYHKKGIAERVAGAISDALGRESALVSGADDETPSDAALVVVRLLRNQCEISIDSSGDHLHRRGYRLQTAKAPLRETLAASILFASGWTGRAPLVDPFCGSGTIVIEAALMAAGLAPGRGRTFAFERWPAFDAARWQAVRESATVAMPTDLPALLGSDRDAGAIEAARANAERAGVGALVSWSRRSISDLELPAAPGWIVTNPPYGERVKGGPDLRNLYARMGSVWRERAGLWHIALVTSSPRWFGQLGLPVAVRARFDNGGLPVQLVEVVRTGDPA